MPTLSSYHNSCPEAAGAITLQQTAVTFDGSEVRHRDELIAYSDVLTNGTIRYFELGYYPVSSAALTIFHNGTVLRPTTDYSVNGKIVLLTFTPVSDDNFLAKYLGYVTDPVGATSTLGGTPLGAIAAYNGSTVPTDWCLADGLTAYSKESYALLFAFASANGLMLSETADEFILKELKAMVKSGPTLLELPAIIKA